MQKKSWSGIAIINTYTRLATINGDNGSIIRCCISIGYDNDPGRIAVCIIIMRSYSGLFTYYYFPFKSMNNVPILLAINYNEIWIKGNGNVIDVFLYNEMNDVDTSIIMDGITINSNPSGQISVFPI